MKQHLTEKERTSLLMRHHNESVRKRADRIKAVLLADEGLSHRDIARVLFLNEETIARHLKDYWKHRKLKNNSGGSRSKLNAEQTQALIAHVKGVIYTDAHKLIAYVKKTYEVTYSHSGILQWLHQHDFSYKSPAKVPAKADATQQAAFIATYEALKTSLPKDAIILFGDGVHPTMQTKVTHGWIAVGENKPIKTTASRTRINLMGAINLENLKITYSHYETINSESMCHFMEKIKDEHPKNQIHLILDQGPYNKSKVTREKAEELGINIHLLPPYSPNLNPIERLWKVMNEQVRNNIHFKSPKEFKEKIFHFFDEGWNLIKGAMISRINDNFQRLNVDTLI
jgi:transposase